jgi:hypothetical protein
VFFDDCHRHDGIYLDRPTEPVKGYHNGRWAACPQDRERDPKNLEKFKPYVQEVIRAHRTDGRVLWWEIFNEPQIRKGNFSERLRRAGYQWAKEVKPTQPVINCWDDNEATDIVDAHNYRWGEPAQGHGFHGSRRAVVRASPLERRALRGDPLANEPPRRGQEHARRLLVLGARGGQLELPVVLGHEARVAGADGPVVRDAVAGRHARVARGVQGLPAIRHGQGSGALLR